MIVTLQTQRFGPWSRFAPLWRAARRWTLPGAPEGRPHPWFAGTLVRLDYHRLGKADKGLVKRYLAKVTGLSRPS